MRTGRRCRPRISAPSPTSSTAAPPPWWPGLALRGLRRGGVLVPFLRQPQLPEVPHRADPGMARPSAGGTAAGALLPHHRHRAGRTAPAAAGAPGGRLRGADAGGRRRDHRTRPRPALRRRHRRRAGSAAHLGPADELPPARALPGQRRRHLRGRRHLASGAAALPAADQGARPQGARQGPGAVAAALPRRGRAGGSVAQGLDRPRHRLGKGRAGGARLPRPLRLPHRHYQRPYRRSRRGGRHHQLPRPQEWSPAHLPAQRRRVHAPLPPARAAARLAQSALLRPLASQSSRRCRPAATDAADAGTAANRAVAGDGGAAGARRGGGGPRDAGRTQDLPALSPRAVDLHPHAAKEIGHGTVIRTLLPPRYSVPPSRAAARHRASLSPPPPMAVTVTLMTPIAIPTAARRTAIWRPNASDRSRWAATCAPATERPR